jgi:DNA-binding response OmpR family regulator
MAQPCILAIECDWRIRKLIRANLEARGLDVHVAVGGPHGLELVAEYEPDLILLDLDLSDMDYRRLLAVLDDSMARNPIPIIVLSDEPPERKMLEHRLIVSYLQKPFSASVLLDHVSEALQSSVLE